MLSGLTYGAGVAAVLIAIMGTVSGTQAVSAVAKPQSASSYKFEDLTITRQVAADGKPNSGFVSYFRLNRALPLLRGESSKGKKKAARVCSRRISR